MSGACTSSAAGVPSVHCVLLAQRAGQPGTAARRPASGSWVLSIEHALMPPLIAPSRCLCSGWTCIPAEDVHSFGCRGPLVQLSYTPPPTGG